MFLCWERVAGSELFLEEYEHAVIDVIVEGSETFIGNNLLVMVNEYTDAQFKYYHGLNAISKQVGPALTCIREFFL